jgi:glycolate oxidase
MLIVEVEGSEAEIADQIGRITGIAARFEPTTMRVSKSEAESAAIWKGRKAAFGAMGKRADAYLCMDGVIPTGRLPEVLTRVAAICAGYGVGVSNVFHAGDGNLHPLILFNPNDPEELAKAESAGADILKLCVEVGGCLTGEHGVGIEKRDLMPLQFTPADLALQMNVKSVFDPSWLLNPAKVFPLAGRPGVVA